MAGGVEELVVFWKEWGIQALVLLSFTLQVILLIMAEIRHRKDSGVLRFIVWSAYMLADTTGIYALGHMTVTSCSCSNLPEHPLKAFWAPFLLLHLGGQDNITAYSIEDNKLWLRHLQTFTVQVLAASYVLYESSIMGRRTFLRPAAILMFVVGVIKYGERVWALRCASSSTSNLSGKNYRSFGHTNSQNPQWRVRFASRLELRADKLLSCPKDLFKGPQHRGALESSATDGDWGKMYQLAEVQLSLMYDVFYSKTPVIHTWYGRCIRVISPMATFAAFLLFRRFREEDGQHANRVDVGATYVLLVGALVVEMVSLQRAMFSSRAHVDVAQFALLPGGPPVKRLFWFLLRRVVMIPRCLVKCVMRKAGLPIRYWSGSMGQHNFIHLCTQTKYSRSSKIARWIGCEDQWNMLVYTSFIPVPTDFNKLLEKQLLHSVGVRKGSPYHITNSRGRAALKRKGISEEGLADWGLELQLDESILVWHIATHVFLSWYDDKYDSPRTALATTIKVLSNYMIFLLAARPYMLPDNASRQRYVELCNRVINHLKYSSTEDLVRSIHDGKVLDRLQDPPRTVETMNAAAHLETRQTLEENLIFQRAYQLSTMLAPKSNNLGRSRSRNSAAAVDMLDLISQVWVEILCYTSYRCPADSHARQLNNGGEITTVVSILMEYMSVGYFEHVGLTGFV